MHIMMLKIKIQMIILFFLISYAHELSSQIPALDSNCEKWIFVASDSINTYQLHRKIMGRVMESNDSLQLIICKKNSNGWIIHKSDSLFTNIKRDAKSITFKRYDTQFTMKISKESNEILMLENEWYRLIFRRGAYKSQGIKS